MAYTSNKKPNALDAATSVAAGNEIVVSQGGVVNKATMTQVENFIFSAKTQVTPNNGDIVVVRRGSDIRQMPVENMLPTGSVTNAMLGGSIADSKLNTISTAGKVVNSATTATNANTPNAIVARDSGGNFDAGTITATLAGSITGNAATATTLQNDRTIAISGDVTGTATSFNGSANITIPAAITANSIVNADVNASAGIVDTKLATIATAGKVSNSATTATSANTNNAIVARDGSGNFSAGAVTANLTGNVTGNVTGNAGTATTLQNDRTIAISGDVTGTATSFNGSANISIPAAITAGSIVDADVNNSAAIGLSKLATGALPTGITVASANIVDGTIVNADINNSAAIAHSKLANIPAGQVLLGNGSNVPTATAFSGDVTVNSLGVTAIGSGVIVNADINASASIDGSKLATATQQALVPAGAVMPFAMNSAPSGWLAANGNNVSRSTYGALFSAIGTTYGVGDGSTTFTLPDLRGYFVRGSGVNGDGTAAGTFGVKQADDFKSHNHLQKDRVGSTTGGNIVINGSFPNTSGLIDNNVSTTATDNNGGTETRPRNIPMLYCIKF